MVVVEGEPIGKGRPRVSSRSGTVYTPRKTVAYEDALRFAGKTVKISARHGPRLLRSFQLSRNRRATVRRRKRRWQSAAGFRRSRSRILTMSAKSALDGIQDVCFEDDRQIVACVAIKAYDVRARLEIELLAIKDEGEVLIAQGEGRSFEGGSLEDLLAKVLGGGSCGARLADGEEAGELVEGLRAA